LVNEYVDGRIDAFDDFDWMAAARAALPHFSLCADNKGVLADWGSIERKVTIALHAVDCSQ